MASRRANDVVNCVFNCLKCISRPATLEAVSDILDIDISSALGVKKGEANVTKGVGVVAAVGGVLIDDFSFSFFFFKTLLATLLKVEIESESL
jgi:hypothetical protein